MAASVTRKLAHNQYFLSLQKKILVREKPYSGIFYTMYELTCQNIKSTSCPFKCCFFVSEIVGLKLNEKRLDFFQFFVLSFLQWAGNFSPVKSKNYLDIHTLLVLRLIPNKTYFILGWNR